MINQISITPIKQQSLQNKTTFKQITPLKEDCFAPSFCAQIKRPSFFQSLKNIFSSGEVEIKPFSQNEPTPFQKDIAEGIKSGFEEIIPPQNFENIMSPDEFEEILPTLKTENFVYDESFDENTLYSVDLDYATLFSSKTEEQIDDLLEKVENHAKKYYEKTGKKFIFAVTDKDNIYGIRQVIRTIGEEPEKYQHFKLVPAIKLSYAHEAPTSKINYENSEMLVYGINPFSENLTKFIDTTLEKRKKMPLNFIIEIDKIYPDFAYNILEFAEQNRLLFSKDYTVSNLYWRAREYAEGKGGDALKSGTKSPETLYKEVESILNSLGNPLFGFDDSAFKSSTNIDADDDNFNKTIREIFEKYSTHVDPVTGELVSASENTYKEVIDCLSKEKQKPIIAFASPFYLSHYFEDRNHDGSYQKVIDFMKKSIKNSNGMIKAFESMSPSYEIDPYITLKTIEDFNNRIRENIDLYEVGGTMQNRNVPIS